MNWKEFIKAQDDFVGPKQPLTLELLEQAYWEFLRIKATEKVPCIACETPTTDCGRWVGVRGKGLGPACSKCYNEAQENMVHEYE